MILVIDWWSQGHLSKNCSCHAVAMGTPQCPSSAYVEGQLFPISQLNRHFRHISGRGDSPQCAKIKSIFCSKWVVLIPLMTILIHMTNPLLKSTGKQGETNSACLISLFEMCSCLPATLSCLCQIESAAWLTSMTSWRKLRNHAPSALATPLDQIQIPLLPLIQTIYIWSATKEGQQWHRPASHAHSTQNLTIWKFVVKLIFWIAEFWLLICWWAGHDSSAGRDCDIPSITQCSWIWINVPILFLFCHSALISWRRVHSGRQSRNIRFYRRDIPNPNGHNQSCSALGWLNHLSVLPFRLQGAGEQYAIWNLDDCFFRYLMNA